MDEPMQGALTDLPPSPLRAEATSEVTRLAVAVESAIGLKSALLVPKIAEAWSRIEPGLKPGWPDRLMAAAPNGGAWWDFVETLLVHETYFYRHAAQLDLVSSQILPRLIAERRSLGQRELRIWCAACATGEEVYTIALLVGDALAHLTGEDKSGWTVHVLGTDVSRRALKDAGKGTYANGPGLNSFRAVPPSFRRHFPQIFEEPVSNAVWEAPPELRGRVRFAWHNLVDMPAPEHDADLVLCRNVLIYFEESMARRARAVVSRALRPGGFLLLGPADVVESADFELIGNDHAFAYRKLSSRGGPGGEAR